MKPLKDRCSITVDGDVLSELKKRAENDERTLSQYINIILKNYIKKDGLDKTAKTGKLKAVAVAIAFYIYSYISVYSLYKLLLKFLIVDNLIKHCVFQSNIFYFYLTHFSILFL